MPDQPTNRAKPGSRPLSALLSQVLVAFTVEVDNGFQRLMAESGHTGVGLSLMVWLNLIRFLEPGGLAVDELTNRSLMPKEGMRGLLGCLERWGFIRLQPERDQSDSAPAFVPGESGRHRRDGWGSGRGIRREWIVQLTGKGQVAAGIWPPLLAEIERRWVTRFGSSIICKLRDSLPALIDRVPFDLPQGLPVDLQIPEPITLPKRTKPVNKQLPLAALLSQALYAFKLEFDGQSKTSLSLCANALRVLNVQPIPMGNLTRLTGASPETSGVGWQLKPYVQIASDPQRRVGKVISLNERGLKAQREYLRLVAHLETKWENEIGKDRITSLRELLESLFLPDENGRQLMSVGLAPPPGITRAGSFTPALGRMSIGVAARRRARDLAAQTEAFVSEPENALPHYPLWDMNRGFGP